MKVWNGLKNTLKRPPFSVCLVLPRPLNQLIFHPDHPPKVCASYFFCCPVKFFFSPGTVAKFCLESILNTNQCVIMIIAVVVFK